MRGYGIYGACKTIWKNILPSTISEWGIFLIFVFTYGLLAIYIAEQFTIVFNKDIPWDAYFSFDNRAIVLTGGGVERHPLSYYFFDQLRHAALLYSENKYNADFRIFLALCSTIAISLGILYIYKYLIHIIKLPTWLGILIILLYGVFFTNIILSFTPENYTYTLLLLSAFHWYVAKRLSEGKSIQLLPLALASISIGGLTITNIVKVFIPVAFQNGLFRGYKKLLLNSLYTILCIGLFIFLVLNRVDYNYELLINKTTEQYEKFSQLKRFSYEEMLFSFFAGGNISMGSLYTLDYTSKTGFEYKAIFMNVYNSIGQYTVIGIVYFLTIWSIIKNWRQKLVKILALSFTIDIIIHAILTFGLKDSYIYGGHFVFIFPLLLGWLLSSYKKQPITLTTIVAIIFMLTLIIGFNNFRRMQEFFQLLEMYYQ